MGVPAGTLLTLLVLASSASAQDGGKMPWSNKDNPKAAMAEAKSRNRAMLLFFTSVG